MKRIDNNKKLNIILKSIRKRIKISRLLLLIVLLCGNTFAWFIFSQKLSSDIDVHVRSWKVMFSNSDNIVSDLLDIQISNMYPGMDTFNDTITIYNDSETNSRVYYNIKEVNIMGTTYMSIEEKEKRGLTLEEDDMTSEQIVEKLKTDYPFIIETELSADHLTPDDEMATFTVNVNWAYESGNDELDTYWGNRAYEYMQDNHTSYCITMSIELFVEQTNDESTEEDIGS